MSNLNNNTAQLELLLQKVNELPAAGSGGIELPTLTNEATAVELLAQKQLIDSDGNIITGTMPNNGAISQTMDGINTKSITIPQGYTSGGSVSLDNTIDNEVTEQADLIAQIKSVVDNLPEAGSGGGGASIDTCTITVSIPEGKRVFATVLNPNNVIDTATFIAESPSGASSAISSGDAICENVICNSIIYVESSWRSCLQGTAVRLITGDKESWTIFKAPSVPNESCSIG